MSQDQQPTIEAYGLTHIGNVREENQDAIHLCDPDDELTSMNGHLFAVADGMGGYAHGGVASRLALETFCDAFYGNSGGSVMQRLKSSMQNANLGVYQAAHRLQAGRMGTTLTAVLIQGDTLHGAHVGDSRAYLVRGGKSRVLTNDHTRVGELVRMKILTPDKVRTHHQRSILSRNIGLDLFVQPDVFSLGLRKGDLVILCSDGVWSVIEDDEFAQLSLGVESAERICHTIIETAMKRDSDDNLSVVSLRLHQLAPHEPSPGPMTVIQRLRRLFGGRSHMVSMLQSRRGFAFR